MTPLCKCGHPRYRHKQRGLCYDCASTKPESEVCRKYRWEGLE